MSQSYQELQNRVHALLGAEEPEQAETLLVLEEFDRGWCEYRYRLAHTTLIERKVQRPRWEGEPIPGRTLLIHDEQGFGDTLAAILCITDLLISVDSSTVHLADALGRAAWVLLPFVPDWRWLMNRDDTPWYPQHKLLRQPHRDSFPTVIANMTMALSDVSKTFSVA